MKRLAVPKVRCFEELASPIWARSMATTSRDGGAPSRRPTAVMAPVTGSCWSSTRGKGYPYARADQVG